MSDTTLSTGSTSSTLQYEGQRAHADYEAAAQALRAAAQATILINGGAATAIIAFLGRATPPPDSVVSAAAWALFFYALGIAAGPYAFWGISRAATLYASAWEGNFYPRSTCKLETGPPQRGPTRERLYKVCHCQHNMFRCGKCHSCRSGRQAWATALATKVCAKPSARKPQPNQSQGPS